MQLTSMMYFSEDLVAALLIGIVSETLVCISQGAVQVMMYTNS